MASPSTQTRVLRLAGGREPAAGEMRRYKLLDRRDRPPKAAPTPVEVTVSAACVVCGLARGEGTDMEILDNSTRTPYVISQIRNPCGHTEMHEALLDEADRIRLDRTA